MWTQYFAWHSKLLDTIIMCYSSIPHSFYFGHLSCFTISSIKLPFKYGKFRYCVPFRSLSEINSNFFLYGPSNNPKWWSFCKQTQNALKLDEKYESTNLVIWLLLATFSWIYLWNHKRSRKSVDILRNFSIQ